jgi:hypothetical protein
LLDKLAGDAAVFAGQLALALWQLVAAVCLFLTLIFRASDTAVIVRNPAHAEFFYQPSMTSSASAGGFFSIPGAERCRNVLVCLAVTFIEDITESFR